ncbi:MAG TPA: hypothetical protein PKZ49_11915, partial [Nitrosomonas sp.]|nr:hypothetical protein [Nitrosomonas sp.]
PIIGFPIKFPTPIETGMVVGKSAIAVGILKGHVSTKGIGVVPAPGDGVALIHNQPWSVEVV